jgi:molybdopterin synthase sulfur carrier subunit
VLYITGEGLKTLDAVRGIVSTYDVEPTLDSFNETVPVAGAELV